MKACWTRFQQFPLFDFVMMQFRLFRWRSRPRFPTPLIWLCHDAKFDSSGGLNSHTCHGNRSSFSSRDFFFLKTQLLYPTKNAPPLDSFVSGSCCHIQTHLILNTTSRMLPSTSSVPPTPSAVTEVWASWHMTTMRIIVRQDCHAGPCHFRVWQS